MTSPTVWGSRAISPRYSVDRLALGQDAKRVIHDELAGVLTVGLLVGLAAGLAAGRYATASLIFVLSGRFPLRPAQFLEWARNTGLLRVTGIAYQCRHDSYQ
jgi:hypothetical protein